MEFLELAQNRYSVRNFKKEPVADEKIEKIVKAGLVAPTACNNQPVKILVLKSEEALEKIKKCTKCHFDAPLNFIICAETKRAWVRPFDQKNSEDVDVAIVTTHMMLEAADLGIGSTWVMFFDPAVVREEFHIPEGFTPVALLPMGYASEKALVNPRHSEYRAYEEMVEFL